MSYISNTQKHVYTCILKDLQKGMPFKKDGILRGSTVLFKRDVLSRTCPLYIDIPTFHQGFEKEHDESSCSCEIGITIIGTFVPNMFKGLSSIRLFIHRSWWSCIYNNNRSPYQWKVPNPPIGLVDRPRSRGFSSELFFNLPWTYRRMSLILGPDLGSRSWIQVFKVNMLKTLL